MQRTILSVPVGGAGQDLAAETPLDNIPNYAALLQPGQRSDADARAAARDLNASVARMLDTSDGRAFWAWLAGFTVQRPTYDHTRPLDQAAAHGLFREGQNSIAHAVLEMAIRGRTAQRLPPETTGAIHGQSKVSDT